MYYRPLFLVWLRISQVVFGPPQPDWHIASIFLHLVAISCVFLLLLRLTESANGATLGAALFAVHPIQTESVAWLSASSDVLLAIFLVLTVYFFAAGKSQVSFASLLFAALAMLTKEVGIVAPLLVFAFAWTRSCLKEAAVRTLPYLAVASAYLAIRECALGGMVYATGADMTPRLVALTWPLVLLRYALHVVWPARLSFCYDVPIGTSIWPLLLLILAVAAIVWLLRFANRDVKFGAAWVAITLLPALELQYATYHEFVHDRYFYTPMAGLALIAASLLAKAKFDARTMTVAGVVLAALAAQTFRTLPIWRSDITLFSRAIETTPNSPMVLNDLAYSYIEYHRPLDALPLLKRLLDEHPDSPQANFNMARCYQELGNQQAAAYYYSISDRLFGRVVR
jgi:tetratricopeptide (TPR) repeat protein